MMGGNMMMEGMGMMIWGLLGLLLGLVVIFLFFVGLAFAVKWVWAQRHFDTTASAESPLDILKKRYAKGEINRDEFERIKKEIE